ncbi:hypothetical protein CPB84DRAFT_1734660 [Gymnopilus junonius]|uniref:Uncharacterized protein n=1 Tax=Gymnopilus junonius TaxID=109634 RepID=A0A9P5TI15_GYMJU|nr:hypothetical protein CPB84DRAFT_1734660 [Gymnopilus junonius]
MKMGYKDHLEGLLAEKEEKIRLLEGHTFSYSARISVLQSRLLTALDTLDSVRVSHAQEVSTLEEKVAHLEDQLHRYNHFAKEAEKEMDDMRDAVMELVEKVEASNGDYSSWPHSQIYLSRLQDPIASLELKYLKPTSEDDSLSYAASMIDALRKERDNERRSHAHTRTTFEARMVALEAQVSRREAELATCAAHIHHDTIEHLEPEENSELRQDMVDSDQIISVLDVTVARNKLLEVEIKSLAKRLENARAGLGSSSSLSGKPAQAAVSPRAEGMDESFPDQQIPSPLPDGDRGNQLQASNFGTLAETPRRALHELDREIQQLGEKVDAFTQERNTLIQTISAGTRDQQYHPPIRDDEKIGLENKIQALEEECDRLQESQQNLRNELQRTRLEARAREEELLGEITTLRLDQDDTERVPVAPLLDESDGEMSMELATPLMPTSIMSTSPPPSIQAVPISRTPSPPLNSNALPAADEISNPSPSSESTSHPLPPSPEASSDSSDLASPATSEADVMSSDFRSPASLPPQLIAEIVEREEAELIDRQRQIEVGETALGELLELVHELNP